MALKELKNHWQTIRAELDALPRDVFISDHPRPTGEWDGSPILAEIVRQYADGRHGWLKGGQDHVPDSWISWPLVWNGEFVRGNCLKCPETRALLSKIPGVKVGGFALMKGGVRLKEHVDDVNDAYVFTYHLGLQCPDGCFLHHETLGTVDERDGKHIVLDARKRHWAENTSSEDRIILYLEICRLKD